MTNYLTYMYLLSPLHTGGTSQEGNLLGIARESHTDLPYLPSSTIRGRLRASTSKEDRTVLWGNTIDDVTSGTSDNLIQGALWVGDGSIVWFPVPSLSHGVVWVSSRFLLRRWIRLTNQTLALPKVGSFSGGHSKNLYLKDAIFHKSELSSWSEWQPYIPNGNEETKTISQALVLADQDCQVLIQSSLWRQVKVKLDDKKNTDGGFRYEEAIIPNNLNELKQIFRLRLQSFYTALQKFRGKEEIDYHHPRSILTPTPQTWAEVVDSNCRIVCVTGSREKDKLFALAKLHEIEYQDRRYHRHLCGSMSKPSPVWIAEVGNFQVVTIFGVNEDSDNPRKQYLDKLREQADSNYSEIWNFI